MKQNSPTMIFRKIYLLFILLAGIQLNMLAQKSQPVLVLIDIQEFYFPGGSSALHEPEQAALQAAKLLHFFREKNWKVVHVRHDFSPGGAIHPSVAPTGNEKVITKKHVNAFRDTDLLEVLQAYQADTLVIAGMQTHMCVEAAVRAASDLGFKSLLAHDACATKDLQFGETFIPSAQVHASTLVSLNRSYTEVISADDVISKLEKTAAATH
jgi:nicotinamidase-related amidase